MKHLFAKLVFFTVIFLASLCNAQYLNIKSFKVNARYGPGKHYPVKYVYLKRNLPVKVVQKFDDWINISDPQGHTSWIKKDLLSKRSFAITQSFAIGYKKNNNLNPTVKIDDSVIVAVKSCKEEWCKVTAKDHKFWLPKSALWGVE